MCCGVRYVSVKVHSAFQEDLQLVQQSPWVSTVLQLAAPTTGGGGNLPYLDGPAIRDANQGDSRKPIRANRFEENPILTACKLGAL